jgi:alpha-amylase/alpha-mannosidase (GH57 family)
MNRYICIHAHFYQPARENPWLEAIEVQDSAAPYHDWNERITRECYAPNSAARILDAESRIVKITNNYSRISFNFGPTLLQWMEEYAPETYRAVLEADRESMKRFSGHGSAIAQAHAHTILPLSNARDKETQILWGIADFQQRFGRRPEGMWLPETAVDVDTLEALAAAGIKFTILAPHQARRVRLLGDERWSDVSGGRIDPSRPYVANLPSGATISLFFYDGPISRAVAFERLLASSEQFVRRLTTGFSPEREGSQLMHIATDGETYGHHHIHGDMALAHALDTIEGDSSIRLTNYGEFLELQPPAYEVEIEERTSWSCAHGVERWQRDCGCRTGGQPGWNQRWRAPLRDALDWLRDTLTPFYEKHAGFFFVDPWAARNDYIHVVNDRRFSNVAAFMRRHVGRELSAGETVRALKLLELQRFCMLMYTSCGWFFNELSGIETVQVLRYAGRVLQLAAELFDIALEENFASRLEEARSNLPDHGSGRDIYENQVRSAMVDLTRVGAHFAVASLFERFPARAPIYGYTVNRDEYHLLESGRAKLAIGRATVASEVTTETAVVSFGVLYLGEISVVAGVRSYRGDDEFPRLLDELNEPFAIGDYAQVTRMLEEHFQPLNYSIRSLFSDEQRRVLEAIWRSTISEAEATYRQLYDRYVPLMQFYGRLNIPLPRVLELAAEFAINVYLRRAFEEEEPAIASITSLLKQARVAKVPLDHEMLQYTLSRTIDSMAEKLLQTPDDLALLQRFEAILGIVPMLPFEVDLWKAQNSYHQLRERLTPELAVGAGVGEEEEARSAFLRSLGSRLRFREV